MNNFCKCKSCSHFFSKNIIVNVIFNVQNFNDTLTNDIVSFEQLGPVCLAVNLITVDHFACLFNCGQMGRVSNSMIAPT